MYLSNFLPGLCFWNCPSDTLDPAGASLNDACKRVDEMGRFQKVQSK